MKIRKLPFAQTKPPLGVEVRTYYGPLYVWYDEAADIKPDGWGVIWGKDVLTWEVFNDAKERLN